MKMVSLKQSYNQITKSLVCPQHTKYNGNGCVGSGKLDPHGATQIHESNPTKLHYTNKSQKNWGYFWWGFSDLGRKQQNQARKHRVGAAQM